MEAILSAASEPAGAVRPGPARDRKSGPELHARPGLSRGGGGTGDHRRDSSYRQALVGAGTIRSTAGSHDRCRIPRDSQGARRVGSLRGPTGRTQIISVITRNSASTAAIHSAVWPIGARLEK